MSQETIGKFDNRLTGSATSGNWSGRFGSWLRFFLTQFPVLSRISQVMDGRFTTRGKILAVATCFFLIGSIHLDSPVYLLAGASLSLLFASFFAAYVYRPKLSIESREDVVLIAGQVGSQKIQVRNNGELSADWLDIEAKGNHLELGSIDGVSIEHFGPGQQTSLRLPMLAEKRGAFKTPELVIRSSYPFDLVYSRTKPESNRTIEEPVMLLAAPRVVESGASTKVAESIGRTIGEQFGLHAAHGTNFWDAREYSPGMATNRWHFPAWAKTGKPHVKQFESLGEPVGCVILDLVEPKHGIDFERKLELVWSVFLSLVQQPIRIGTVAWLGKTIDIDGFAFNEVVRVVGQELATVKPVDSGDFLSLRHDAPDFTIFVGDEEHFSRWVGGNTRTGGEVVSLIKVDPVSNSKFPIQRVSSGTGATL